MAHTWKTHIATRRKKTVTEFFLSLPYTRLPGSLFLDRWKLYNFFFQLPLWGIYVNHSIYPGIWILSYTDVATNFVKSFTAFQVSWYIVLSEVWSSFSYFLRYKHEPLIRDTTLTSHLVKLLSNLHTSVWVVFSWTWVALGLPLEWNTIRRWGGKGTKFQCDINSAAIGTGPLLQPGVLCLAMYSSDLSLVGKRNVSHPWFHAAAPLGNESARSPRRENAKSRRAKRQERTKKKKKKRRDERGRKKRGDDDAASGTRSGSLDLAGQVRKV